MCTPPAPDNHINYLEIKDSVRESTGFFDPAFIKSTYKVLVFNIDNYKVSIATYKDSTNRDVPYYKRKAGKFPTLSGDEFQVIFFNPKPVHSRVDSLSYFMQSPLFQRNELGVRKGLVKMKEGSFDIPVPESGFTNITLLHNQDIVFSDTLP